MRYTDEYLQELITCPKKVSIPPKREMKAEGGHKRNDMTLESLDGHHRFQVFIRLNDKFEENFSIGLRYQVHDEARSFVLLRCNGKHGEHRQYPHHAHFHIHRSMASDINNGIDVERHAEISNAYASFRDALAYFCRVIHLRDVDIEMYFQGITQRDLFEQVQDASD